MNSQILQFFMILGLLVGQSHSKPVAIGDHDVELIDGAPKNQSNNVENSTTFPETLENPNNTTTLSGIPNNITQQFSNHHGEDMGITENQNNAIANNSSMENDDVGHSNITNSQPTEVPHIATEENPPSESHYVLQILVGFVGSILIVISILLRYTECIPNPKNPRMAPRPDVDF